MRIISRGIKPEDKLYRGTCKNCKTVFECNRSEGKYENDFREGGGFLRVTCPLCQSNTEIAYERKDDQLVPRDMRQSSMAYQMSNFAGQDER
jgi:RNase P subunit RPR2